MRFCWADTYRTTSKLTLSVAARLSLPLLLLAYLTAPQLNAQTATPQPPPAQQQDEPTYTLHVYANLLQIPTLVLSTSLQPFPPIEANKFNISLDSGKPFHPTQMRREGNDPIDLALVFDAGSDAYPLQSALSSSILSFATESLRPHDHVSIYAIDCVFIRSAEDMPATDANRIAHGFDAAIHNPLLHGQGETRPRCSKSVKLWNALTKVAESLSTMPGRRVIFVVSTGIDHDSSVKWRDLAHYAADNGIALFGLSPPSLSLMPAMVMLPDQMNSENPFQILCQNTGGLVLVGSALDVPASLKQFIDMVRGRYILEFPKPNNGSPGRHEIKVTITKTEAFIRPAGVTYPAPDSTLDPTTIVSPPSPATFGTRRPTDPHP
jgi:hypothetical protein